MRGAGGGEEVGGQDGGCRVAVRTGWFFRNAMLRVGEEGESERRDEGVLTSGGNRILPVSRRFWFRPSEFLLRSSSFCKK